MDLYISREYGSRYPAVRDLGIGVTNADKKVMRRGWIDREEISVTLPNIFDEKLLFPDFTATDSDGEIIITKFFKHHKVMRNLDLSEYYDSEYTETESECSSSEDESEDEEVIYNNNTPPPIIMGTADTLNNFVTAFNNYLR
ncbi:hypothetical protein C1645_835255 [Glomus cerebriforme]|uniref:Uncharacterized protein n=1 Tax=Glomus cerebriforme TaxID=658196 RepID=A0A397SET9_9GLOM|nr:hypothetical protein C1645_835255 [Glomus cerebriforme]